MSFFPRTLTIPDFNTACVRLTPRHVRDSCCMCQYSRGDNVFQLLLAANYSFLCTTSLRRFLYIEPSMKQSHVSSFAFLKSLFQNLEAPQLMFFERCVRFGQAACVNSVFEPQHEQSSAVSPALPENAVLMRYAFCRLCTVKELRRSSIDPMIRMILFSWVCGNKMAMACAPSCCVQTCTTMRY